MQNERLVFSMSLPQRIRLITGAVCYKSRSMEAYAFPEMEFSADPMGGRGARATDFPSDTALMCAFDADLAKKVYTCIGNEAKACAPNAYYDVANRSEEGAREPDPFIRGRFAAGKTAGLNASGTLVNYNDMSRFDDTVQERIDAKLISDEIFHNAEPDSVVVRRCDEADCLRAYKYGGLQIGFAETKEEAARFLLAGYSFVFLATDFTDELVPYLTALTAEYKKAYDACARGKITPEKIDMCCRELTMLPESKINEACDRVIDRLITLSGNNADAVWERKVPLGEGEAKFDEPLHDGVALDAARQSAVLIKNDGVLPLSESRKVAVFGEYAKDKSYHASGNMPTAAYLPFEVINEYDIQTAGFAYGYRKGEPVRADLLNTARKLCNKADVALVYLCAAAGEHVLPTEQTEFIDALAASGKKIVAVVASDGAIDLNFASKCNAVLLTHRGGQKCAHAVFDILTGFVAPAGRLPYAVRANVAADGTQSGAVRYPLGYGLSYTSFSYRNLQITDGGASLTVVNEGDCGGYATVLLYVRKKATKDKKEGARQLRGYARVYVEKRGAEKVHIPFGEATFCNYRFSEKLYCIDGGAYTVEIGETETDVRLSGELTLKPYVYGKTDFHSEEEQTDANAAQAFRAFSEAQNARAFYLKNRTAPAGGRIFAALMLALYFDVTVAVLYLGNILPSGTLSYLFAGVLLALLHIAVLVYCVAAYRRHKKLAAENVPIADDAVEKLGTFRELATVSYENPVSAQEAEEAEEEQEQEEETLAEEEEIPVYTYDTGFTEGVRQQIRFRNDVTFADICANFHDYMLGWGVETDLSGVRALMAAIAACKLVFVDVKNKEALPNFLIALGSYFQGADVTEVSPDWKTPADLFWTVEGDKYVASGFVNTLYAAERTPDKNAVAILNRVHPENLRDWLGDIIRYALLPGEKHIVKLNDSTQLQLPNNVCYLLFTEDGCGDLPADLAAASVQIELTCSAAAPSAPVEIKPVSRQAFEELVSEAREQHFLPEAIWKKTDDMTDVINAGEPFGLGNKCILQLERFTSVLLSCGADESEAFTAMFTAKIVALLKNLQMYKADKGDKTIFGIIEKLFGDENLTKIRKALMKASRGK